MRNVGHYGCGLLGRLLIFATRHSDAPARPAVKPRRYRFKSAGSPPCAVILTDSARSVA